jgi:hypothetical protein
MGRVGSFVFAICLVPFCALAQPTRVDAGRPSDLCQQAIAGTKPTARLPPNLLTAIGRVESGRMDPRDGNLKAWPWSINAEGRGYAFNSKAEAIAAVMALRARNVASVDVGCMQVNLMYHPSAFASLDEAFDPAVNVRYAVKFLNQLYAETKDWNLAAAYYHSKTPDLAASYQQKVLAQLPGAARVQVASTEQLSLTNAWAATLGAPQPTATKRASSVPDMQSGSRIALRARPHALMLASRR